MTSIDQAMMRRALGLARQGWGQTAPNPMVGAVVVAGSRGGIVAEGYHRRFGGPHAEVEALRAAGSRAHGATLYVSLEPCAHHGKTPPCTDAIIDAGIARVVAAVHDPSPAAGGGAEVLRAAGIQVDVGVEQAGACELNAPFFFGVDADRPWIVLKFAMSADDAIAVRGEGGRWITGEESRREVHRLRAGFDAIAVGVGTVLADNPELTVRNAPAPRIAPRRVIFDSTGRVPLDSAVVRTARQVPTTIVAMRVAAERRGTLDRAGVEIIESESLSASLRELRRRGVRSMFVEGGAQIGGALLAADLVDRLTIFRAPSVIGPDRLGAFDAMLPGAAPDLNRLPVIERRPFGDDEMTTYALRALPCSPA